MTKQERIARILASEISGIDPDRTIYYGEPQRVQGLYAFVTPTHTGSPCWTWFVPAADLLMAELGLVEGEVASEPETPPAASPEPQNEPTLTFRERQGLV